MNIRTEERQERVLLTTGFYSLLATAVGAGSRQQISHSMRSERFRSVGVCLLNSAGTVVSINGCPVVYWR